MAFEGQTPREEPEFPKGQLAFGGALDFGRRKRGQIGGRVGRGLGFSAIDSGQGRFPFGHPASLRLTLSALAVNHGGVEELWRQAGQAAMGPQSATERDQGGAEVVGRAPAGTERGASPANDGGAYRPPARMAEPGQGFTFCLP
jgi:hypothetical protein